MKEPFFSVLLPAFNARGCIGSALSDLLAQTFRDFEVLVVDDGSTDGTGDAVKRFSDPRIRLITLPQNLGLVGALNAGLAEARALWIARQDADDRCRADRLERQRELIVRHPDAVLFYSRATLIDERGWWRGTLRPPVDDAGLRWDLCFRNPIPHTSAVFSTKLVRDGLGGYGGQTVTEDYELWSELLRHGKAVGHPERLVSYRNHSNSIMGRANSGGDSSATVRLQDLMCRNLREWAGASEAEARLIAAAWTDPSFMQWQEYFEQTDRLIGTAAGASAKIVAEQDYTLMHRAFGRAPEAAPALLAAMRRHSPGRYAALPQPRTFLSKVSRLLR